MATAFSTYITLVSPHHMSPDLLTPFCNFHSTPLHHLTTPSFHHKPPLT